MTAIFMPLMLSIIGIRIFTRVRILRSFGWDDIFIIAAAVPTLGCGIITTTAAITLGWNRHIYDVPFSQLILGLKLTMLLECLFATGCTLTKLSLLFFTRKIMKGSGTPFLQWLVIANIWIVGIELIIFLLVVIFTCRPVSLYWTLSSFPQECINESAHLLASGAINTATDIAVIILPIPSVLSLSLPTRQRVVLVLLFGAGFGVCIAGGVRAYYTYRLNIAYDKTWEAYYLWISGTVELYVGVIGASLASLRPFFARYFPTIFGNQRERRSYAFSTSMARRYGFRRSNRGKPKPQKPKEISQATTITMNGDFDFTDLGTYKSEIGREEREERGDVEEAGGRGQRGHRESREIGALPPIPSTFAGFPGDRDGSEVSFHSA
ncbi:uncharacterized protein GIQ15_02221 [Arthroderma uncinatum]|uniref:uncharacterized protein n=1 Tax=Arthroderma uncinatum TaxID=74035 RepID=UPI00144AEB9F|nr:uncharacterized protein GIQ15_02221 [Arthroderma uncinatum]KAF3482897.1 integral membrane protein [Arthroderma uncinatum]